MTGTHASLRDRLERLSIPEPNSGCLLWLGSASKGYGYIRVDGKMQIASRVSFRLFRGDPGTMDVCHHCDNTYCIEPNHLFLGTAKENSEDMVRKGRRWMKLSPSDVAKIRVMSGSQQSIADRFGVSQTLISQIMLGKTRTIG